MKALILVLSVYIFTFRYNLRFQHLVCARLSADRWRWFSRGKCDTTSGRYWTLKASRYNDGSPTTNLNHAQCWNKYVASWQSSKSVIVILPQMSETTAGHTIGPKAVSQKRKFSKWDDKVYFKCSNCSILMSSECANLHQNLSISSVCTLNRGLLRFVKEYVVCIFTWTKVLIKFYFQIHWNSCFE